VRHENSSYRSLKTTEPQMAARSSFQSGCNDLTTKRCHNMGSDSGKSEGVRGYIWPETAVVR